MNKIETNLLDCYILEPKRFGDTRGYYEAITMKDLQELGFECMEQVSQSMSTKGTIRGMHYQLDPYCQAKVVRCIQGSVIDVVVDLRVDSPSFKKYTYAHLLPERGRLLYVPRGFAHGFIALKDNTLFEYYVDNKYMPQYEDGIYWNDPDLGIPWQTWLDGNNITEPILSEKDKVREPLCRKKTLFKRNIQ